ncbi:MAG: serine protease, partial [Chloroflexi bacterium]|nr:serine protease [Chloroflexota bacterium]
MAVACERAGELIPGEDDGAADTAGTPQDPVLTDAALRASGGADDEVAADGPTDIQLVRSVVQISVLDESGTAPALRDGSGVIIDRNLGLILTSALVVAPFAADGTPAYDSIAVATNPVPGSEPRLTHYAVLLAYDPLSELAVLRIEGRLVEDSADGTDGAGASETDGTNTGGPLLDQPAVALGDSAGLRRGDAVRMFGHPGLDPSGALTPQAVMVTAASLTGVRDAPGVGARAWLKTDARLPHGSGGGPVFNDAGELVGIVAQIAYGATAPVAHVRPIALAEALIAQARDESDEPAVLPLTHLGGIPGTALPGLDDGVAISEPRFAREAIEEGGERELFDYGRVFPAATAELHYEFVAQGVPNGATVQELWYLDGVFQDELSATYSWELGPFALVSDRLASPNPQGNPQGEWTLEVWVGGAIRASARASLGAEPPLPTV